MFNRIFALFAFLLLFSGTALAGSISGTISYSGSQTVGDFGAIHIAADTVSWGPDYCGSGSCSYVVITSPGAYTITGLPDGTYYVATLFAISETSDIALTDPYGAWNGLTNIQPVVISGNNDVTGINITAIDGTEADPNPFYIAPLTDASANATHTDPNMGGQYSISFWLSDNAHLASTVTVSGPNISGSLPLTYSGSGWYLWNGVNFGTADPSASLPLTYTFTATKPDTTTVVSTATVTDFINIASPTLAPSGGANVLTTPTFTWPDLGANYEYDIEVIDVTGGWAPLWATWDSSGPTTGTSLPYPGPALQANHDYIWQFRATDRNTQAQYWKQASFTYQRNDPPDGYMNHSGTVYITAGGSVYFSGGATDPDGDLPLTYFWNFASESGSGVANSTAQVPGSVTFNNPGFFYVTLTVTDSKGLADPTPASVWVSVAPPNVAPFAIPGGPYSVDEGSSVTVDAAGSFDSDGSISAYAWDLDNNGSYETAGSTASFNAAALDGPAVRTIGLRVTDNLGAVNSATTTVTINNVAPTASITGPYTTPVSTPVDVTCDATDPGPDSLTITWDLDDNGSFTDATGATVPATFASGGTHTIRCKATDDDGGVSPTASSTVDVTSSKDELIVDFGNPFGLWVKFNNGWWGKIHALNPAKVITGDLDGGGLEEVIADFPPYGLYGRYNNSGGWVKLHALSPETMASGDMDGGGQDELAADFGAFGIYLKTNNGAWSKIHALNPESLTMGDLDGDGSSELVADFGIFGIYKKSFSGPWTKLHTLSPDLMTTGDLNNNNQDELITVFSAYGVWVRNDNGSWTKLHSFAPEELITGDLDGNGQDDIVADFGVFGIYTKVNSGAWTRLHMFNPEAITVADLNGDGKDEVIADFGLSYGIWGKAFTGAWFKLHALNPEDMTSGSLD